MPQSKFLADLNGGIPTLIGKNRSTVLSITYVDPISAQVFSEAIAIQVSEALVSLLLSQRLNRSRLGAICCVKAQFTDGSEQDVTSETAIMPDVFSAGRV